MYAVYGLMFVSMVVCTRSYSEEYIKGSYENWVPIPNDLHFTTSHYNHQPQYFTETANNENLWTPVNEDFISGAIDTGNVIQVVKHDHNKTNYNLHESSYQPAEDEEHKDEQHKNISIQNLNKISIVNHSSTLINKTNEHKNVVMRLSNMKRLIPSRKPKDIKYKQTNNNNNYESSNNHDYSTEDSLIIPNKIKTNNNQSKEENTRTHIDGIQDNEASSTQRIEINQSNRLINNLNTILSAYNIHNDDTGRNYRISRQYKKEVPKRVNRVPYVGITDTRVPIPHQQHLMYTHWKHLPVDPLFAVLLSRYGVYS